MSSDLNALQQELETLGSRYHALYSEGKALLTGTQPVPSNQDPQGLEERMQALTLRDGDEELQDLRESMQALTLGDGIEGEAQLRARVLAILPQERRRVRDMERFVVELRNRFGSQATVSGSGKESQDQGRRDGANEGGVHRSQGSG